MPKLLQKTHSFHVVVLVAVYWIFIFAIPFIVVYSAAEFGVFGWFLLAALVGFFGYTGFRAPSAGRRLAFIVQIVIPAVLRVTGTIVVTSGILHPSVFELGYLIPSWLTI